MDKTEDYSEEDDCSEKDISHNDFYQKKEKREQSASNKSEENVDFDVDVKEEIDDMFSLDEDSASNQNKSFFWEPCESDEMYECKLCTDTFSDRCSYRKHLRETHETVDFEFMQQSGRKPEFCKEEGCNACFSSYYFLRRHLRSVHNNVFQGNYSSKGKGAEQVSISNQDESEEFYSFKQEETSEEEAEFILGEENGEYDFNIAEESEDEPIFDRQKKTEVDFSLEEESGDEGFTVVQESEEESISSEEENKKIKRIAPEEIMECTHCNDIFTEGPAYRRHLREMHETVDFEFMRELGREPEYCLEDGCNACFSSFLFLCKHLRRKHNVISEDKLPDIKSKKRRKKESDISEIFPSPSSKIEGFAEVIVPAMSDELFLQNFGLTRSSFLFLCQELRTFTTFRHMERKRKRGKKRVPLEKAILMTLWIMGTAAPFQEIAVLFGIAKSTVHCTYQQMCQCILELGPKYIRFPNDKEKQKNAAVFEKRSRMTNILGSVGVNHMRIWGPKEQPHNYVNRNSFHSIILQGLCGPNTEFFDVYIGWPGQVHDGRVFKHSPLFMNGELNCKDNSGNSYVILANSGYPLKTWMLTPFDNDNLTEEQQRYNSAHLSTSNVIDKAFGLLKGRFKRLQFLNFSCIETQCSVVMLGCILHNMCVKQKEICFDDYYQDPPMKPLKNILPNDGNDAEVIRNKYMSIFS